MDNEKQTYKSMGYKRYSMAGVLMAITSKKSRATSSKAKKWGISGNLKGDGLQTGGTLIVSKGGGRILLNFKQEVPGDHVALEDVFKALDIHEDIPVTQTGTDATCSSTSSKEKSAKASGL